MVETHVRRANHAACNRRPSHPASQGFRLQRARDEAWCKSAGTAMLPRRGVFWAKSRSVVAAKALERVQMSLVTPISWLTANPPFLSPCSMLEPGRRCGNLDAGTKEQMALLKMDAPRCVMPGIPSFVGSQRRHMAATQAWHRWEPEERASAAGSDGSGYTRQAPERGGRRVADCVGSSL